MLMMGLVVLADIESYAWQGSMSGVSAWVRGSYTGVRDAFSHASASYVKFIQL
jgi:hypothetical protein